jgi:hypothetical protein
MEYREVAPKVSHPAVARDLTAKKIASPSLREEAVTKKSAEPWKEEVYRETSSRPIGKKSCVELFTFTSERRSTFLSNYGVVRWRCSVAR